MPARATGSHLGNTKVCFRIGEAGKFVAAAVEKLLPGLRTTYPSGSFPSLAGSGIPTGGQPPCHGRYRRRPAARRGNAEYVRS
jgi:hypothetical protein